METASSHMDTVSVLVLYPSFRDIVMSKKLPRNVSGKFQFIYHDQSKLSSLEECLEDARKIISQNNIKVVLASGDTGALLRAAIVQEFPHLRGPSVESVFLANNKYYTRCFLDPQPIPFASLDLTTPNLDQACEEALEKVGTPAFFKPTVSTMGTGVSSIQDVDDLKQAAVSYITNVDPSNEHKFMSPFYARYVDKQKYPLASKPTAIVEQHMRLSNTVVVNTDNYVFDGKIHHWSISDSVYSKTDPLCYLGGFHPTALPESIQEKVWTLQDKIIKKMIEVGFDYDFVNVETFVSSCGEVKLMEVNPRKGFDVLTSGEESMNGTMIEAQLKLALGENPGCPVPRDCCTFHATIKTYGSGKAEEFFDYNFTSAGPIVFPTRHPKHQVHARENIGQAFLSGSSYGEVMEKYWSICKQVLLKPKQSIWN